MTAIQTRSLPVILNNQDVLAQAKTGSGKTAAFAIGLLNKLELQVYATQALVLCPTRELADQVSTEIRSLARSMPNTKVLTLCGGKSMRAQLGSLERSPHIVIGTPGRVLKHLDVGSLRLTGLSTLVLDEADRMLDMGFYADIMRIVGLTPGNRQTLLFSATYPAAIEKISSSVQNDPVVVKVDTEHTGEQIKQVFFEVSEAGKIDGLITVLNHYEPQSCLIFCNRKQHCQQLADALQQQGFDAQALHGDLEQPERDQVLVQFANHSTDILVATDVAARGLDIKELSAVISFDITPDPEMHVHRIGRTGRAGNDGLAITFFVPAEKFRVEAIENYQAQPVQTVSLSSLRTKHKSPAKPAMVTLCVSAGRKDKIRPGDILGALTADAGIEGSNIGKIDLFDKFSYVAVDRQIADLALSVLTQGKIKGRNCKVRILR